MIWFDLLVSLWSTNMVSTVQKIKFSIKDFFSKCDQIHSFLRLWSHLLKKFLIKKIIFCAVGFSGPHSSIRTETECKDFILQVSTFRPNTRKYQTNFTKQEIDVIGLVISLFIYRFNFFFPAVIRKNRLWYNLVHFGNLLWVWRRFLSDCIFYLIKCC